MDFLSMVNFVYVEGGDAGTGFWAIEVDEQIFSLLDVDEVFDTLHRVAVSRDLDALDEGQIIPMLVLAYYPNPAVWIQADLQVVLDAKLVGSQIQLIQNRFHHPIAESRYPQRGPGVQRGLLQIHYTERGVGGKAHEGDVYGGLDCERRAKAHAQVRFSSFSEGLFQLFGRQFFPKVNDGIMEIPCAVLALPAGPMVPRLLLCQESSLDGPEVSEVQPLALDALLQVPVSVQLRQHFPLHPRPQVQSIRVLRNQELEGPFLQQGFDGHVRVGRGHQVHQVLHLLLLLLLLGGVPIPDSRASRDHRALP